MKIRKPSTLLFIMTLIITAITTLSCKKSINTITFKDEDAVVVDRGNIAADGCGWQIVTSPADSTYTPQNLDAKYQVDNLKIRISYHKLTTRFYCSQVANNPGPGITKIQLDAVSTR